MFKSTPYERIDTGEGQMTTGQTMQTDEPLDDDDDSNPEEDVDEVQYGKPDEILYFTNRFELGLESCY